MLLLQKSQSVYKNMQRIRKAHTSTPSQMQPQESCVFHLCIAYACAYVYIFNTNEIILKLLFSDVFST